MVVGLTGTGAAAGDTLTVNWGGQTVTYTLLAGDISANSATVTVPAATITAQGHGTFNVTARLTDAAGNASANSTATSVTVDTVAPTAPSITSIAENGGGGINAGEASDGTPVVVGLAGTGAVAGDTLTVNWGSQTVTYTLLAADISANSATVTVPPATITAQGQGTFDVTARLTDVAGNAGANSSATSVTVDTVAPTATVAITAIATDSGTSSSDYVTNDTTLTVSGTHGPLGPGEKVQVSSDGGASWADVTTSTASTWSYTDPTTHATSFTYQVRIVDAAGNVGANTASQAVTIDTAAPTAPSITSIAENGGGGINAGEASNGTPVVVGLARHRGGGGRHADRQLGRPDGHLHAPGGRHLGQQRDGDGASGDDRGAGPGHVQRDGPADRRGGQCRRQLDGHLGDGRHGGADGDGCDHGHCHRQRHVVERLRHQRHDADGVGHARPARRRRDGAGQQRRRRQLGRCHHQHGEHLELYRSHDARARASPTRRGSSTPRAMSAPTPPARR